MTTGNQSRAATRLRPVTHTMAGAGAAAIGTGLGPVVWAARGVRRLGGGAQRKACGRGGAPPDKEFGIGRPYLDKDPPHIAPIDGKEYADKRGVNTELADKGSTATGRDVEPATFQE